MLVSALVQKSCYQVLKERFAQFGGNVPCQADAEREIKASFPLVDFSTASFKMSPERVMVLWDNGTWLEVCGNGAANNRGIGCNEVDVIAAVGRFKHVYLNCEGVFHEVSKTEMYKVLQLAVYFRPEYYAEGDSIYFGVPM